MGKDLKIGADSTVFNRRSARGILLRNDEILLLYSKRYNDYSFPGGGVEVGEDLTVGLKRELLEEAGAQDIKILSEFGYVDELRTHFNQDYEFLHMLSYYYVCEIGPERIEATFEHYEIAAGMEARWVNVREALFHNQRIIEAGEKSLGVYVYRETRVLKQVVQELLA